MRRALLAVLLLLCPSLVRAQDTGVLTQPSRHGFEETLTRLEAAVRQAGLRVFTRLDHAAAAREAGLAMPPTTVLVFGNPAAGTPLFLRQPTLALDLPLRALVWQDQQGRVSVSWNTAAYLLGSVYPRHGIHPDAAAIAGMEQVLARIVTQAVE
ncbi:MAG TPA: DUF302 domain-containing protein [Roseomonas sp.]|jgi:uncharacterized protein (DUF302 family)